jgi:hypothetical protein
MAVAGVSRHRLLAGAHPCPDHRCLAWPCDGTPSPAADLQIRSSLWPAPDLWPRARSGRRVPPVLRCLGAAISDPRDAEGRPQSRLHVPAGLPGLGDCGRAVHLFRHLVRDRAHEAWRLSPRCDGKSKACAGIRYQCPGSDLADLRLWRGARRVCRRPCSTALSSQPVDGLQPDYRRLRCRGHWRHGLHNGRNRLGFVARPARGADEGLLSAGLQHRRFCRDGGRSPRQTRRSLWPRSSDGKWNSRRHRRPTLPPRRMETGIPDRGRTLRRCGSAIRASTRFSL